MSLKALQDYTLISKYARHVKERKRRETWQEAVYRMRDMHLRRYPQVKDEINWAFEQVLDRRVLGSQRALQYGGAPIERKHARMYNCCTSYCDRIRMFQEAFWLLLCGSGVGFSVQTHHIAKLPGFDPGVVSHATGQDPATYKMAKGWKTFEIPDSIEGWADALGILLASFIPHPDYPEWLGHEVFFDYALISPKGTPLGSGVGKAPGPEPLMRSLEIIRTLLKKLVCSGQDRLKSINCYDIIMHASDAVLSGGVRRSATICLFSPEDDEMLRAKFDYTDENGVYHSWYQENPQRGRSNNSVVLIRDETTKEQFEKIMSYVKQYGEPGFVWADSKESTYNPCVPGDAIVATKDGLRLADQLLGRQFEALVNGKAKLSTKKGFFSTGNREVFELVFESGRKLRVTSNHQILTKNGWKEAGDLLFDDEVIINNHRDHDFVIDTKGEDYARGYCLGNFLSDGNVCNNSAQMKWWGDHRSTYRADGLALLKQANYANAHHVESTNNSSSYETLNSTAVLDYAKEVNAFGDEKKLSREALIGSWDYLAGLIAGYFDGDGTVAFNPKKGSSIRFTSSQMENLQNLQIALNSFGIYSKIYDDRREAGDRLLPDGKGGKAMYHCEAVHELIVSCDNIEQFQKMIPIRNQSKKNQIEQIVDSRKRTPNKTDFSDRLVSMKSVGEMPVFDCTIPEVSAFDSDGVYVHNCVEINLLPRHYLTGESGWAFCNLCEINGSKLKSRHDFEIAARAAAIIGTLQAGYTDFAYLGNVTKEIADREALLGVSMTGMMDNPHITFDPELQREMAKLIVHVNQEMAGKIGIRPAARCTCVKPAGNSSALLGTGSGIHPHHSRRYIRHVQANATEAPFVHFAKTNPHACEQSVWNPNGTDFVMSFLIETPETAKLKKDLTAVELLEHVKLTQQNWVASGKVVDLCVEPWLNHNVSNTINVAPHEWDDVTDFIYSNRKLFAGISLLPSSGDKDYPQAPFTAVYTRDEIIADYKITHDVYADAAVFLTADFKGNLWDASRNFLVSETTDLENFWKKCEQFFSDRKVFTYFLKDVYNWKKWERISLFYKDVDYETMIEEDDNTKFQEMSACAGGACETMF